MNKIMNIIQEYIYLNKKFSFKIANNRILEILFSRLAKFSFFEKKVIEFYRKKHNDIINILEVNLEKFLEAYTYNNDVNKDNEEKYIFSLWLQGYENAPIIVKKTIESQKKYAQKYGYNYILLDEKNLYDFVDMPIELVEKYNTGKIDAIKYSDIIRTILLSEYGGVWLDSTIYLDCSEKLEYLESKFYTIRASGTEYYPRYVSNGRWALFCLAGEKNNIVFDFLKKIQLEYYRLYDSPIDYYLIDYLMEIGYKNIDEIKLQVDSVLDNNKKLYYLVDNFSNTFNRENWNEILEDTRIFKCSYKILIKKNKQTYYSMLIENKL